MPAKAKFNAFRFSVTGSGYFPVDMLRYDRACPMSQDDVAAMALSRFEEGEERRTVALIAYCPAGNKLEPTAGRWASFGWNVNINSITPVWA